MPEFSILKPQCKREDLFCHLQAKFVKIRIPISYQHWLREYLPDGWNPLTHMHVFWLYCLSVYCYLLSVACIKRSRCKKKVNHGESDYLPKAMYVLKLIIFQKQLCNESNGPELYSKQYPQMDLYSSELNMNSLSVSMS